MASRLADDDGRAKQMAKVNVELDDSDIRAAVAAWAKLERGVDVQPDNIDIRTENEWRGHGSMETQFCVPKISFTY